MTYFILPKNVQGIGKSNGYETEQWKLEKMMGEDDVEDGNGIW